MMRWPELRVQRQPELRGHNHPVHIHWLDPDLVLDRLELHLRNLNLELV